MPRALRMMRWKSGEKMRVGGLAWGDDAPSASRDARPSEAKGPGRAISNLPGRCRGGARVGPLNPSRLRCALRHVVGGETCVGRKLLVVARGRAVGCGAERLVFGLFIGNDGARVVGVEACVDALHHLAPFGVLGSHVADAIDVQAVAGASRRVMTGGLRDSF